MKCATIFPYVDNGRLLLQANADGELAEPHSSQMDDQDYTEPIGFNGVPFDVEITAVGGNTGNVEIHVSQTKDFAAYVEHSASPVSVAGFTADQTARVGLAPEGVYWRLFNDSGEIITAKRWPIPNRN
ncbi:MAG TPA: hypothetical protein PKO33_00010 [Pyrinomonadaceae bacterium]|nr:hypothetical protein [Pyrinomonadaceae bacterium]